MLISVFTHMQASTLENYFKQIVRVLKTGGKIYASFFMSQKNRTYVLFPFQNDTYCLHNKKVTNVNVAYRRDYVYDLAKNSGLGIIHEKLGWWSKGYDDSCFDFQDIIVFKKL